MSGPAITIRKFQSHDVDQIIDIFQKNLVEEWTKYHDAKYLSNAKKYIEETIKPKGDLKRIQQIYFEPGGFFWVLEDASNKKMVVGYTGLEIVSDTEGELRRMCTLPEYRGKGWGRLLGETVQQFAKEQKLVKLTLSTPEHGVGVIQFYSKLKFVDTGKKREPIHNSPVREVFLECTL